MDLTPIFSQLADVPDSFWVELLHFPKALILVMCNVAILMGGAIVNTKLVIRHRERMAKIQMDIAPDAPPMTSDAGKDSR
jgi:hypothetical protein